MEYSQKVMEHLVGLQQRQQALMQKQQGGGDVTQDEIDALRRLQREAQSNPSITAYVQAQQQALAFLPRVNREISQLLGFDFSALARATSCCGAGGQSWVVRGE